MRNNMTDGQLNLPHKIVTEVDSIALSAVTYQCGLVTQKLIVGMFHTLSEKRGHLFFSCISENCAVIFVIFGMHHSLQHRELGKQTNQSSNCVF